MNTIRRTLSHLISTRPVPGPGPGPVSGKTMIQIQGQQCRGIRVKVLNGNLEQALVFMQRKMQSSGIERMIKREQLFHIKDSEKRILAKKNLERKIRSKDLARKLQAILINKVRGL